MKLRYLLPLLILLVIGTELPSAAAPFVIRFSHVAAPASPKGKAAAYFRELVEQGSHGQLLVEIRPEASLYGDRAALQALHLGLIEMAAPDLSLLTDSTPQLKLLELPFLFDDTEHPHRTLDGPTGSKLLQVASKDGLRALAFWDRGLRQFTADRPLRIPADATGLKLRIHDSRVLLSALRSIGANPQRLPFSEIRSALQQQSIAGQESTLATMEARRYATVQSDLTLSNHAYSGALLVIGEPFWRRLPEEARSLLLQAAAESTNYLRELVAQHDAMILQRLATSGRMKIHHLPPEQRRTWQHAMRKVYPQFADQIGAELIENALRR